MNAQRMNALCVGHMVALRATKAKGNRDVYIRDVCAVRRSMRSVQCAFVPAELLEQLIFVYTFSNLAAVRYTVLNVLSTVQSN